MDTPEKIGTTKNLAIPVPNRTFEHQLNNSARVVKLVDTQDLKSCGLKGRAGSSPAPGTAFF